MEPSVVGWARVPRRPLEADMFVAVKKSTHLEQWRALLKRAASSSQVFDWNTRDAATTAHLARIEGKWFVVQFYKSGDHAGQLATAFVPNQAELGAMLRRLGH